MSARTSRSVYHFANQSANPLTILHVAPPIEALKVIQYDQTYVFAPSIMLCSEEIGRLLQRSAQLSSTSEVQHGNLIDCSFGAVFARWWRLGILSLARL